MDFTLRCNDLKCRKELPSGHAVVTTCSHIFCIDCSNHYKLNRAREGQVPSCPACNCQLRNADDVVITNLNPTEDYKSSVLSGLNPNIVMECAGRALSWWAYQAGQEIIYQDHVVKHLSQKYTTLSAQLDKVVHDANSEITNLRNEMSHLRIEHDSLRRKNEDLSQAFRDKSRKHMQTQEMFDKMKRRSMLGQVQNAALDNVDSSIEASVAANRHVNKIGDHSQRPPPPLFAGQQGPGLSHSVPAEVMSNVASPGSRAGSNASWPGYNNQESYQRQSTHSQTTHRQPLGPSNPLATPRIGVGNFLTNNITTTPQPRPTPRHPLSNINSNIGSGFSLTGYGMSAGLKVSNSTGVAGNNAAGPQVRSRVANRSVPPANRDVGFGQPAFSNMFANGSNFY